MAKGKFSGGRKVGSVNKHTRLTREQMSRLKASGKDPLSFFLSILQNDNAPHQERKEAASELLPYMHPKLSSIEARTGGTSHEDRLQTLLDMMQDDRPRSTDADSGTMPNDNNVYPLLPYQQHAPCPATPGPQGEGEGVPAPGGVVEAPPPKGEGEGAP